MIPGRKAKDTANFRETVERTLRMMENLHAVGTDVEMMSKLLVALNRSVDRLTQAQAELYNTSDMYKGELELLRQRAKKS